MMSFFRKVKGSVSLILIFVMFPMLTQATMIVDASRINSAKTAVSGAGDLAMNAALSQYDRALQDIYGLFAVSGDDIGTLQETFKAYFGNTLQGMLSGNDSITLDYIDQLTTGVVDGIFASDSISEDDMVNHLAMNTVDLTISGNSSSTLSNPAVMKTQIVEYMKYKAPLMFTTSILDQMNALSDSTAQSDAVQAQVTYTQQLDTLQDACNNAKNSIDTYNGNVISLDIASGGPNAIAGMFADGGSVKSKLASATENLLYYRNIYEKYWSGDNPIYPYSDFSSALNEQPDPPVYSLEVNSSTKKYTGNVKGEVYGPSEFVAGIPLQSLNEEMYSSDDPDSTAKVLVKDSSYSTGNYEELFALEYRLVKTKQTLDNSMSGINDVNSKLDGLSGEGISYIQSYYDNIVQCYTAEELAVMISDLQNYGTAYDDFMRKLKNLTRHVYNESDDMLLYILKDSTTNQPYESDAELTNTEKLKLEAFRADYATLSNYIDISDLNLEDKVKYDTAEDGTRSNYDVEVTYNQLWSERNQSVKDYENSYSLCSGKNFSSKLYMAIVWCETHRNSYKTNADTAFTEAWNAINAYKNQLNTAKDNAADVASKLAAVKTQAENVKGAHNTWGDKIDQTPDGSTKDTMDTQHAAEGEKVIPEEIDALIAYANAQKSAYEAVIAKLDAITYFGTKVYSGQMNADTFVSGASGGSWRGTYNGSTALANITDPNEVSSKASTLMNDFYQPSDGGITDDVINNVSVIQGQKFIQFGYGTDSTAAGAAEHQYSLYFTKDYAGTNKDLALTFYKKLLTFTKAPDGQSADGGNSVKNTVTSQLSGEGKEGSNTNADSFKQNNHNEPNNNTNAFPDVGASYSAIKAQSKAPTGTMPSAEGQVSGGGANDINNVSAESDNSGKAGDYNDQMAASSGFIANLAKIVTEFTKDPANTAINYMYLEEYFRNMFSCQTTNVGDEYKNDKEFTLEGIVFSPENNAYYQMEQEYIIFGDTCSPGEAVAKSFTTIFGIRFVLNTIYAFTSSEIQTIACNIATAIAGWTVFGIPLVQAIVTIIFALAESGMDLYDLKQGESVPIYKTASTWKCSISGITREIATSAVEYAVDEAGEFMTNVANGTIDNIKDEADAFVTSQVDAAVGSVKDKLFAATTGAAMEMYSVHGDALKGDADEIKNQLKEKIRSYLDETIGSCGEGTPVEKAVKTGMDIVSANIDSFIDDLASEIVNTVDSGKGYITQMQENVSAKIDEFVNKKVKKPISDKLDVLSKDLKDAAGNAISATTDDMKAQATESVQKALDEYLGEAADTVTENIDVDSKDTKGTICMNYKQYLQIFMLIGIAADQNGMLNRCAALIECNMNYMPGAVCPYKKEGYSLKIPSAYTLVDADASVEIRTIFSYSATTTGGAGTTEGLYSDLAPLWGNSGTSTLHYKSVMGY